MVVLKDDETLDDLMLHNLRIIQKKNGFRFTLDAVLLGHFATLKANDLVVDLGTGTGVIPFVLSTRAHPQQIIGVELQEELAEMAQRSVAYNGLEEVIRIVRGDLKEIHKVIGGGKYNLVIANPPYWLTEHGRPSPAKDRAVSRHQLECSLEDVVNCASKLLNYQGRFALIYPTARMLDLFALLRSYKMEPRKIRFIHSYQERPAHLMLVEARKSAPADLLVLPPLIIYNKPGEYGAEILGWYGKEVEPNGEKGNEKGKE